MFSVDFINPLCSLFTVFPFHCSHSNKPHFLTRTRHGDRIICAKSSIQLRIYHDDYHAEARPPLHVYISRWAGYLIHAHNIRRNIFDCCCCCCCCCYTECPYPTCIFLPWSHATHTHQTFTVNYTALHQSCHSQFFHYKSKLRNPTPGLGP